MDLPKPADPEYSQEVGRNCITDAGSRSPPHRTTLEVAPFRAGRISWAPQVSQRDRVTVVFTACLCWNRAVLQARLVLDHLVLDKLQDRLIVYTELGREVKMEIPGTMGARSALPTMCASRADGEPSGGLAATEAGQRGHRFWRKTDRCVLRGRDAFVPAGAVVGPTRARRGSFGCACGGYGRPRRFARHSPRHPGPRPDTTAPGPLPVRSVIAFGGRAFGLLPARHLPGGRRSGDLRSGLPPGAFARRGTGAAGCAGVRAECVSGLHDVRLLRRRRADLPALLGRHDARQLRPRGLRRQGWRERAGGPPLYGDGPRRDGLAAGRVPFPDRAGRGVRLCGPSRGGA